MNYVESFNLLGVEAKQIPCIKGEGAPTTSTEGAVGCFYIDTLVGTLYKCTAASSGNYTWETFEGEKGDPGADGKDGVIFTPIVSADGTLSWTNNGGLTNPEPVNIVVNAESIGEIAQTTGDSETAVMSQKAVTEEFNKRFTHTEGVIITSNNYFDRNAVEQGGYYDKTTGAWVERSDMCSTGLIPCKSGESFYAFDASSPTTSYGGNLTLWDKDGNFVEGFGATTTESTPFVIPENDNIAYFRLSFYSYLITSSARKYCINKGQKYDYDTYYTVQVNQLETESDIIAPNITKMEQQIEGTSFTHTEGVIITSNNYFDRNAVEQGGYYDKTTGAWVERSDMCSTGLIPCKSGDSFYTHDTSSPTTSLGGNLTLWDKDGNFVTGFGAPDTANTPFTIPENDYIAYFRLSVPSYMVTVEARKYCINKGQKYDYDVFASRYAKQLETECEIIAPNITELSAKIENLETPKSDPLNYYSMAYSNVTSIYGRSSKFGTSYIASIISKTKFDGTPVRPIICGTSPTSPLGDASCSNVINFAREKEYTHVINGGIFNVDTNEAHGITIMDGVILKDTVDTRYVLGIDNSGNFKTYIGTSATDILADGCNYAFTGFNPLIIDGERVANEVLAVCAHFAERHPRQIVGTLNNGDYFTFCCDGRTDGENGMTLAECIEILQSILPIKFAFNLDGGGSTQTVTLKKQINRVIDNRIVPNVIVFA